MRPARAAGPLAPAPEAAALRLGTQMADAAAAPAGAPAADAVPAADVKLAPVCCPGDTKLDADAVTLESLGYKARGATATKNGPARVFSRHMRLTTNRNRRRAQPRLTRFMSKATSAVCGITMLTPLCGGVSGMVTALSYGGPGITVWGWCAPPRRARRAAALTGRRGARRVAVAFFTINVALGMAEARAPPPRVPARLRGPTRG